MLRFNNVAELNREYMRRAPTLYGILAQVHSTGQVFQWNTAIVNQTLEQQEQHIITYLQNHTISHLISEAIADIARFLQLMYNIVLGGHAPEPPRQPSRPRRGDAVSPHRPEPNVAPIREDQMISRDEYANQLYAFRAALTAYEASIPRIEALQDTLGLIHQLRVTVGQLHHNVSIQPQNHMYRQVDVIATFEEFQQLFNLAQEDQRRACTNQGIDYGPDAFEEVDYNNLQEIPSNNFIQLTSGVCWQVDSLVGLIKYTNGMNSVARNGVRINSLRNYPTETIWTDPADLQRLLVKTDNSPDEEVRSLREFLERIERNRIDIISDTTMNMLVKTMHLLSAKGPETEEYFNAHTTSEPYLRDIWTGAGKNVEKLLVRSNTRFNETDPANIEMFRIARIDVAHTRFIRTEVDHPDGKNWYLVLPEEEFRKLPANIQEVGRSFPTETAKICTNLYVINKSLALGEWEEYFRNLSDEEKSAINTFVPDLQLDIGRCMRPNANGQQLCAMVTARTIFESYNNLRQRKGLPRIPRPFTDQELHPPAICADVQAGLGLYEGRAYQANML